MDISFHTLAVYRILKVFLLTAAIFLLGVSKAFAFELVYSARSDRVGAQPLNMAVVKGNIAVFVDINPGIKSAQFFIDSKLYLTEKLAPWDMAGTATNGGSKFYNTQLLSEGEHSITAQLVLTDDRIVLLSAQVIVDNLSPILQATPLAFSESVRGATQINRTLNIQLSGSAQAIELSSNQPWLSLSPATGVSPLVAGVTLDSSGLAPGPYSAEIAATSPGAAPLKIPVTFTVGPEASSYSLMVSASANRSSPVALEGQQLGTAAYIFLLPESEVKQVRFFLDDPAALGSPMRIETGAPFDLMGSASNGNALPWTVEGLTLGAHNLTAEITYLDNSLAIVSSHFDVVDAPLVAVPLSLNFTIAKPATQASSTLNLTAGSAAQGFSVSATQPWVHLSLNTGTTPSSLTVSVEVTGLVPGVYNADILVSGSRSLVIPVSLTYTETSSSGFELKVSSLANRSNAVPLEGAVLKSNAYVHVKPEQNISRVEFFIDRLPGGTPDKTEGLLPFDFAGTATNGSALPFDTTARADGNHVIYALVTKADTTTAVLSGQFRIANQLTTPEFSVTPAQVTSTVDIDSSPVNVNVLLGLNAYADGMSPDYLVSSNVPWASASPVTGTAPESLTVRLDPAGLSSGKYTGALTITSSILESTVVPLSLVVDGGDSDACAPVICSEIRVALPYVLDFTADAGHLDDKSGKGTGFTYVMPSTNTTAYVPLNIDTSFGDGLLRLSTTNGIMHLANNNQANAVGVGFAGPNQIAKISTLLVNPPSGTGKYEQAGLWFGTDENNYIKIVYSSYPTNPVIEVLYERNGVVVKSATKTVGNLSSSKLLLELIANPSTGMVIAAFTVNGGARTQVANYAVEPEMFSFDAAGIDPVIGTRSFAGLMTTHRNAVTPITYAFDYFRIEAVESGSADLPIQFSRVSHPVAFPTSMAWAPDGKLYVTELFGTIHALTYDANLNVIEDQIINSLIDSMGTRLTLGITVRQDDPLDNTNYSLWISSSSPSIDSGVANSSNITRLSGPGFGHVQQIITGLPRAIANHAVNSLHFGPDNRLYMSIGGNTGGGAPVAVPTEFGDREEQPLSSAIVVADVFAENFDGSCANNADIFGPAPCDVTTYATGLRNSYDFVFHSNGSMYATDNGLGVIGAFPPSPTPSCRGVSNPALISEGGNNPGAQVDLLLRILPGKYYGHPNPSRAECVFKNGSFQGVAPLPNYQLPLLELSKNASADGITEYKTAGVCPVLEHNLLLVRYSLGDDIIKVQLSADGTTVVSQNVLVGGFNDPLFVTEHNGNLYVAEMGGGKITALKPATSSCL